MIGVSPCGPVCLAGLTWKQTVVGRESGRNEGSWSPHFTGFALPTFPPACCFLCVESRGCQLMVRTDPTGAGEGRRYRTE